MPQGSITTSLLAANSYRTTPQFALNSLVGSLCAGKPFITNQTISMSEMRYTLSGASLTKLIGAGSIGTLVSQGGLKGVALSADGSTLAVGGRLDNNQFGAIWVYTRSGGTWTQQAKLVGTGNFSDQPQIGSSVALSADGNTLVAGGPNDISPGAGNTWVFTRSGGTWTQQAVLLGTGATSTRSNQGSAVALSADGNILAIGAPQDQFLSSPQRRIGAVWIFTRSGGTWTQQGSKIIPTGFTGQVPEFGTSVALSADGSTLAVGAPGDNAFVGATYIITSSGGTWTQQSRIIGTGNTGGSNQGRSVALSADGNTLVSGGENDQNTSGNGAAWVFTRSGGTWTQQALLIGTGFGGTQARQGIAVSIAADGNVIASGGSSDSESIGAVWIFTRTGTTWTQQGSKITPTSRLGSFQGFGLGLALSGNGSYLASGGPSDNSSIGAVWVIT
jgi:hypothetical protein